MYRKTGVESSECLFTATNYLHSTNVVGERSLVAVTTHYGDRTSVQIEHEYASKVE